MCGETLIYYIYELKRKVVQIYIALKISQISIIEQEVSINQIYLGDVNLNKVMKYTSNMQSFIANFFEIEVTILA